MSDPYAILGVGPAAGDAAIRAAYLAAVERRPPDRDPEGFKAVRAAFDAVKDASRRLEIELFGLPPVAALQDLVSLDPLPRHVGPEPWLALIAEARR